MKLFFNPKFMVLRMFSIVWKQLKVFYVVIILNSVYVVDNLFGFKIASKGLLHNKTASMNITLTVAIRMFRSINKNISSLIFYNATFPMTSILSRKLRKYFILIPSGYSFFKFCLWRKMLSFFKFSFRMITYFKACFSSIKIQMSFLKSLVRFMFINSFRHLITSKIKAVFRFLTEMRLNISTLLTADFRHNNTAFPLDVNSITQNIGVSI